MGTGVPTDDLRGDIVQVEFEAEDEVRRGRLVSRSTGDLHAGPVQDRQIGSTNPCEQGLRTDAQLIGDPRDRPCFDPGSRRAPAASRVTRSFNSSGYFLGASLNLILPCGETLHQHEGATGALTEVTWRRGTKTGPGDPTAVLAKILWRIEHDYREPKTGLGLDHVEGRSWLGWYHHVTLVTAAHLFLTTLRSTEPKASGEHRPSMSQCVNANAHWTIGLLSARSSTIPFPAWQSPIRPPVQCPVR